MAKPVLKWVGGKSQLLDKITPHLPDEMENYHEPFVGGGSMLFHVLELQKKGRITVRGKVYASDVNPRLITMYRHLQEDHLGVYEEIQRLIKTYNGIEELKGAKNPLTEEESLESKESYYYFLRNEFNTLDRTSVRSTALLIVLNKLCFRGVYREGPNGFNVPFGHYKTTPVIKPFDTVSELIKDVEFSCTEFEEALDRVEDGDFVYMDPPYHKEKKTSFVGYTNNGFRDKDHERLFELAKAMPSFMLSNANTPYVRDTFSDYECETLDARRAIHSRDPSSTTKEVLVIKTK